MAYHAFSDPFFFHGSIVCNYTHLNRARLVLRQLRKVFYSFCDNSSTKPTMHGGGSVGLRSSYHCSHFSPDPGRVESQSLANVPVFDTS